MRENFEKFVKTALLNEPLVKDDSIVKEDMEEENVVDEEESKDHVYSYKLEKPSLNSTGQKLQPTPSQQKLELFLR